MYPAQREPIWPSALSYHEPDKRKEKKELDFILIFSYLDNDVPGLPGHQQRQGALYHVEFTLQFVLSQLGLNKRPDLPKILRLLKHSNPAVRCETELADEMIVCGILYPLVELRLLLTPAGAVVLDHTATPAQHSDEGFHLGSSTVTVPTLEVGSGDY